MVSNTVEGARRCYEGLRWKTGQKSPRIEGLPVTREAAGRSTPLVSTKGAPLWFAKVGNGKSDFLAMIDSGAQVNVVGKRLVDRLTYTKLDRHTLELSGCGGRSTASEWVRVPLEFSNGLKVEEEMIVSYEFGEALVLGAPFLHANKIGLEYNGMYMRT